MPGTVLDSFICLRPLPASEPQVPNFHHERVKLSVHLGPMGRKALYHLQIAGQGRVFRALCPQEERERNPTRILEAIFQVNPGSQKQ